MKDSYPLTWVKIGGKGVGRLKQREFGLKEGMVKCLKHVWDVKILMFALPIGSGSSGTWEI